MFDNVALDVVIGLVFIYLLYSLLATVVAEIIATSLGLRARNLKEAVDRMLNDEDEGLQGSWIIRKLYGLWDSLRIMKNPKNDVVTKFYNHPEIKYLGSSGLFKNPSSFSAVSFAKTLMLLLNDGEGPLSKENISQKLNNGAPGILGSETSKYVLSLWEDSYGDLIKFQLKLEGWFDRTMQQTTEWYKRKIQVVLLLLGFSFAWSFNADTFGIIKKLSTDKTAREQMVSMASAYIKTSPPPEKITITPGADSTPLKDYNKKLDSLLEVKKKLDEDIRKANSLLGTGSWLPDSILFTLDSLTRKKIYASPIEEALLPDKLAEAEASPVTTDFWDKLCYFFRILRRHFWGFLITAIAVSLGAPFWYDLLNKLMKLRTSVKQPADSGSGGTNSSGLSPLNREA